MAHQPSGTVYGVKKDELHTRTAGWLALLLSMAAPVAVLAWVAASMANQSWAVALLPLPFLAIWAARPAVNTFLADQQRTSRAEGVVQFTPSYFAFHARRAGVPWWPFWTLFLLLVGVLVAGWLALIAGAFFD